MSEELGKRFLRLSRFGIVACYALVFVGAYALYDISFYRPDYLTGWFLFYIMMVQAFYYLQNKYSIVPLPGNLQWLQLHTEFGLFAILIFCIHLGWTFPSGSLGIMLSVSLAIVAITGILGLIVKRRHQNILAHRRGSDVVFEKIPQLLTTLHKRAEALIVDCASTHNDSMLVDYYVEHLAETLCAPDNLLAHLLGNDVQTAAHLNAIEKLMVYLDEKETECAQQLMQLLRKKNRLDSYYAHHGALKIWLLIHVPFVVSLMVLTLAHIILVYAFAGSG